MTTNYGNHGNHGHEVPTEAPISRPVPGAHLADPAPLGLAAFALTTFLLSVVNAGWMDGANEGYVLGVALAYGGIVQFAAGMWEFAKGNTFGAVAFSSYGAFWVSFWWLVEHDAGNLADPDKAVGWYLFAWGIFTLLGGYLGLLTAIAAWYTSFAAVTAFTFKRPMLPVWSRT